jgi:phosphomannomutase
VPEVVAENGGTPVRTRVGHSFIKAEMARTGASSAGEHSGHFYFAEFWNADSGMLAALHALRRWAPRRARCRACCPSYSRYAASGEINSTVDDLSPRRSPQITAALRRLELDELDASPSAAHDGWWFNVAREQLTEPSAAPQRRGAGRGDPVRVRVEVLG